LANLILTLSRPNGRPYRTHQRREPDGAFEKRHVPERPHRFARFSGVSAGTCEDEHR
jgi:hypothetical protein